MSVVRRELIVYQGCGLLEAFGPLQREGDRAVANGYHGGTTGYGAVYFASPEHRAGLVLARDYMDGADCGFANVAELLTQLTGQIQA